MSIYQIFSKAIPRLTRTKWGNSIVDRDGKKRDSGVNELAEELAAIFASRAPLALDEPIRVIKNYTGTTFEVVTEPNVEAANDPLSVDAFGGVKINLEDIADAVVEAQKSADDASDLAATALAKKTIFPGVVTEEGDTFMQNPSGYTLYKVQIDLNGSLVEVNAYPYRDGSRAFPVGTRVMVHRVDGDLVIASFLSGRNLIGTPNYFFVEPYSTA